MVEPSITYHAKWYGGKQSRVDRVVIHATCPNLGYPTASLSGHAYATALYFQHPTVESSAHYIYDAGANEEHCVPDDTVAYHAPPNQNSIGIEICGELYTRLQWTSPEVFPGVVAAAQRTAELCTRFDIPIRKLSPDDLRMGRRGICGHIDVSTAFRQSTHTDPGTAFPWDDFIPLVESFVNGVDMPLTPAEIAEIWANPTPNYTGDGKDMPAFAALGWSQSRASEAFAAIQAVSDKVDTILNLLQSKG